jgi:hypothetical protein
VTFLVQLFFVENLLNAFLVLFPYIFFSPLSYNSCGSNDYRYDKTFHVTHSLNFYT